MQRITPKPVVAGNLSALIQKSDGKKAGLDYAKIESDGEYYVRFKSIDIVDISERRFGGANDAIKMRLSTPYAGFDHGMHFPLPQGVEVLVGFTNGDPDLPVIMGAVNNSLSPSLSTADNNTDNIIKTPSGNRITLSDHKERRGITLAVPSVENGTHYDAVQTISPGEDPKISSWVDTIRGDKYSNFLGSSFSLSAGTSSSISASLSSSVSLASSVSMSAGISNTINLGSMGVSWSPKIPKIHDLVTHTSLSLGDGGQSVSYGNDSQVIETHKSFEIKTGAIDHSLDAKVLESNEVFLKSAIAASLVFDIAASFALQQAPEIVKAVREGRIEKDYKKAIDDANSKYKESISKAEQITEEKDRLEKKRQAIDVLEEDKDAAANIRSEKLKDLEKDFFVDNGWGMRLTSNGARAAIQGASNIAILKCLKQYGEKLKDHTEKVKDYKSFFKMDNKKMIISRHLDENNPSLASNLIGMDKYGISIEKQLSNQGLVGVDILNDEVSLKSVNKKDLVEVKLNNTKKSIVISNQHWNVEMTKDSMVVGEPLGASTIKLDKNSIRINTKKFEVIGGVTYTKNDIKLMHGALLIRR